MKTSVDDIYAAGDVAEGQDFFTGKPKINATIASAVRQGKVAGANMAGTVAEYEGGIPMAAFNFFGNQAFSIGAFTLPDKSLRVYQQKDDYKRKYKRLVFDGDRLVGAMFLNEKMDPGIIFYLIKERINVASQEAALFEGTKPLSNPWLNSLSSL
jgi:phenylglyoxylate dehydrogenase epsilon subunit